MRRLENRIALVTGASSGIGWATAQALAREGAWVALAARRREKLDELVTAIESEGRGALALPTDVRDREQVVRMVEQAHEAFGRLDILVNNAGVGYWERLGIVEGALDEWQDQLEANLLGLMVGTHAAAQKMAAQGSGHIVNVSSLAGRFPYPQTPAYVVSKAGVNTFSESSRRDLARHGIRVTLVEPGEVATPIQPAEDLASKQMLTPEDVADAILYAVTRPPYVCVNDIALVSLPKR